MATIARPAAPPRRLVSPGIRAAAGRRLAELAGIATAIAAIALLIALATYNPRDPSLDTATADAATNLAGRGGALVADLLLQGFGLAAVLPALAMLAWAWRIASGQGVGHPALRVGATLAAMPVLSMPLAIAQGFAGQWAVVPGVGQPAWPSTAGIGGAVGTMLSRAAMAGGKDLLGPAGTALVLAVSGAVAVLLCGLGFGLSPADWRRAGRQAAGAARLSARQGARAADGLARAGAAFAPLLRVRPLDAPPEADEVAAAAAARPALVAAAARASPARALPEAAGAAAPQAPATAPARRARVLPAETRPPAPRQASLPLVEEGWQFPQLSLLKPPPARIDAGPSEESLQANARLLETVLGDYGVQGVIREIRPGPVVTLYELEPAPGIRSARVIGLADDVARSLSVAAVRIATVQGRNAIGIEVPNSKRQTVLLSELFETEEWTRHPGRLPLALGKDIGGGPVVVDLARMPHLLIAGTTGSGKSVGINAMILSLLFRMPPEDCRLILIDPKMLELSVYEGVPHLLAPVVTEPAKAVSALKWTVREMERRYRSMSQLSVRNISGYNERVAEAHSRGEVISRRVQTGFDSETGKPIFEEQPLAPEKLPLIVVVIDEMADLMMVAGKEIEAAVQRLAQMARAAGIHVIMATQRPSVDVITGTIKANFPTRISFQVISKFDSRTILGEQGSEQLLGMGDMLYMVGGGRIMRVHGPFVTDREVEDVVAFLRTQGEPAYLDDVTELPDDEDRESVAGFSGIAGASDGEKGLFDQAVALVAREGKASTSFIQRHLQIGYNRAAKLIEQMEKEGIVSSANHVGKREVLVRTGDE